MEKEGWKVTAIIFIVLSILFLVGLFYFQSRAGFYLESWGGCIEGLREIGSLLDN